MSKTSRFLGAAALTAAMLVGSPVQAGEAETAYLHSLGGTWVATTTVKGQGRVECRLDFKATSDRVNYKGRCTDAGANGAQSFSGSIRYSDQRSRYESSTSGKTVVGKKSGQTLTFVTEMSTIQGDVATTMSVSPSNIKVQFRLERDGETMAGNMSFSRS